MSTTDGPPGPDRGPAGSGPQDAIRGVSPQAGAGGSSSVWQPREHAGTDGPQKIPVPDTGGEEERARRRRSTAVKLGVTAAVIGGVVLVGSAMDSDDDPEYQAVCVDQDTQQRIDDDYCGDHHHGGFAHVGWYYFAMGHSAPRIGGPVSGGSYSEPRSTYVRGGVPRTGGTVDSVTSRSGTKTTIRGGFGSSFKGSGS